MPFFFFLTGCSKASSSLFSSVVWICKWWVWSCFSFAANYCMCEVIYAIGSCPTHLISPWQQQPQPWIQWLCARTHTTVQSIKSNKTNAWFRVVNVVFPWWQRDNLSLIRLGRRSVFVLSIRLPPNRTCKFPRKRLSTPINTQRV